MRARVIIVAVLAASCAVAGALASDATQDARAAHDHLTALLRQEAAAVKEPHVGGRRLSSRAELYAKLAARQAALEALLADGSDKALGLAVELAADLAALRDALPHGDPLDKAIDDAATAAGGGVEVEEWVDASADVIVVGGPAVDTRADLGRRLEGGTAEAGGAVHHGGGGGHVHHVLVSLKQRHPANRVRPRRKRDAAAAGGGNGRARSLLMGHGGHHGGGLTDADVDALAESGLHPLVTTPELRRNLRGAEGVPLSGFTYRSLFVSDVTAAPARTCADAPPLAAAEDGASPSPATGRQQQRRRGRRACRLGASTVTVDADAQTGELVKSAWRAAVRAKVRRHHPRHDAADGVPTGGSGGSGGGARGLGITPSKASGVRRVFMARVKWSDQADNNTAVTTEAASRALAGSLTQLWREQSLNRLVPVVTPAHHCVYSGGVASTAVGGTSYVAVLNTLPTSAANHPDPTCRFTLTNANYEHLIAMHPYSGSVSYAGLAYVPGWQSLYNGQYANLWVVAHEAGHNWGLLHGWISDPLNGVDEEYGDNTEVMASARDTWGGLAYMQGEKDGLTWSPPGSVLDFSPLAPFRSRDFVLVGTERVNGTDNAAPALSGRTPAYVSARVPMMDGLPSDWVYATWRPAYNPGVINGAQLHTVPFDFDIFGDPINQGSGVMGPPNLLDVTGWTQDQADADLEPGNAFVYATPYSAAARVLIETTGARTRVPAASTSPADDVLPMRWSWLTPGDGERPEGRGCDPSTGECAPPVVPALEAQPPLPCNGGPVSVTLTPAAQVGVLRLEAPDPAGPPVAVTVSTCATLSAGSGATVATAVGLFTAFPHAQVVGGGDVSSGAYTASSFRLAPSGGVMVAQPCGEAIAPLRPGQPFFVAVAAPGAWWGRGNATVATPPSVAVSVTATCGATQPNTNRVIKQSGVIMEMARQATAVTADAALANAGPGGLLTNGRASFTAHEYPWLSSRHVYWDGSSWRQTSTNLNTRPALAGGAGSSLASTAGSPDVGALSSFFPACPPDMYLPYTGTTPVANVCAPCPAWARSNAGSSQPSGTTKCECSRGSFYDAGAGACAQCPVNTYRTSTTAIGTASTCTACPSGTWALPGGRSSLACSPLVCARLTIARHFDARVNGVWERAGSSGGLPAYAKSGGSSPQLWLVYRSSSASWTFAEGATAAAAAGSPGLGPAYVVPVPAPPQYWVPRHWPAAPGVVGAYAPSVTCTCPAGMALDVTGSGGCNATAPVVPGCPEGQAPSGAGGACAACPPFQVASGASCVCPPGYTVNGPAAIAGGALACEPPQAVHVADVTGGSAGSGYAPPGVLGRCALSSVRVAAWGALAPVYRCGPPAGADVSGFVSPQPLPRLFLVPHPDRREWSFAPDDSGAHSPRFGYWGGFTTAATAGELGAFLGVTLPLGPAVRSSAASSANNVTTWSFWHARGGAFSYAVRLALTPVTAVPAADRVSVAALVAAATSGRRLQQVDDSATAARALQGSGTCALVTASGAGLSGSVTGLSTASSPWTLSSAFGSCSGATFTPTGRFALVSIDVGAPLAVGATLSVSTCPSLNSPDTTMYVGGACPAEATAASLGCAGANDDDPTGSCGWNRASRVNVSVDVATSPLAGRSTLYVFVGSYYGYDLTDLGIAWSIVQPTPSASLTASPTATVSLGAAPSTTPSPSRTAASTASSTATPTPTRTPTATRSVTPPVTGTPTPSSTSTTSATASLSVGSTPTPSATTTATRTPPVTPTLSPGACPPLPASAVSLVGASGSYAGSLVNATPLYTAGLVCTGYSLGASTTRLHAPFAIDLGLTPDAFTGSGGPSTAAGSGGTLTLSTCGGASFDTTLFGLSGCLRADASATGLTCSGNDDACSLSSTVTLPLVSARGSPWYAGGPLGAIVTSYSATVTLGTFTLSWAWTPPPSGTPSPTATPSPSLSAGASPSGTPSPSGGPLSPSGTPSGTASRSASRLPSASPTGSLTAAPSTSPTASMSTGASPSPSFTGTASASASRSVTASATSPPSASQTAPPPSPSPTRSNSPSPGFCGPPRVNTTGRITGLSGFVDGNLAGEPARFSSGGCGTAAWSTARPQALWELSLPSDLDINGTLTFNTCASTGSFDTMVAVLGGGCPWSATGGFNTGWCLAGNDDSCGIQSQAAFTVTPGTAGSTFYVLVMGYSDADTAGAYRLSWSWSPPPIPSPTRTPTTTGTSTLSPGAPPSLTPTASLSGTATSSLSRTPSGTASITQTPTGTSTKTGTASVTPSGSRTPSGTPTGTRTPPLARLLPSSVVVVRVGDAARPAVGPGALPPGTALPVYLDEYAVGGGGTGGVPPPLPLTNGPATSLALPGSRAGAGAYGHACTLAHGGNSSATGGWWHATEGLPSLSGDGAEALLPCYDVPVGSALWPAGDASGASSPRGTLAVVAADGGVDTTTVLGGAFYGPACGSAAGAPACALRQAASADGWTSAVVAGSAPLGGGYRALAPVGGWGSREVSGSPGWPGSYGDGSDARGVGVYGGASYGSAAGGVWGGSIFTLNVAAALPPVLPPAGYPTVPAGTAPAVALPGVGPVATDGLPLSPWGFVFASSTTLWVADDAAPALRSLLRFTRTGGSAWAQAGAVLGTADGLPVRSVAGRAEASSFVLYTATDGGLYRVVPAPDAASAAVATVATPPPGAVFRGVVLAPADARMIAATASPSLTPSPSGGADPSGTPSGTPAGTGTPSGSAPPSVSGTPSPSRAGLMPSQTTAGSPSGTPSAPAPSASGSNTATAVPPSASGSRSATPSSTRSGSGTPTGSRTQTGTASSSPSPGGTVAASGSGTAAATGTASSTSAASATGTGTAASTATRSASPPASPSAAATASPSSAVTPSRTATASGTASPPVTQTASVSGTPPMTGTPTGSGTPAGTPSPTGSPPATPTPTRSVAPSSSASLTGSASPSPTGSDSPSGSSSPSVSNTASVSGTPSRPPSPSVPPTASNTKSTLPSASRTRSRSATVSATPTRTRSATRSRTRSRTATRTRTGTKNKGKGLLRQ